MNISMQPIALVRSPFNETDARIPRRDIVADIIVREEYAAALTGIEDWSHLFILFWMQQPSGQPPRLLTHPRHRIDLPQVGVLAARGRERPNPIGLAIVELLKREGNVLTVQALDAYDGTPVLDIKPYDRYDIVAHPRAPDWWLRISA